MMKRKGQCQGFVRTWLRKTKKAGCCKEPSADSFASSGTSSGCGLRLLQASHTAQMKTPQRHQEQQLPTKSALPVDQTTEAAKPPPVDWTDPVALHYVGVMLKAGCRGYTATPASDIIRVLSGSSPAAQVDTPSGVPTSSMFGARGCFSDCDTLLEEVAVEASIMLQRASRSSGAALVRNGGATISPDVLDLQRRLAQTEALFRSLLKFVTAPTATAVTTPTPTPTAIPVTASSSTPDKRTSLDDKAMDLAAATATTTIAIAAPTTSSMASGESCDDGHTLLSSAGDASRNVAHTSTHTSAQFGAARSAVVTAPATPSVSTAIPAYAITTSDAISADGFDSYAAADDDDTATDNDTDSSLSPLELAVRSLVFDPLAPPKGCELLKAAAYPGNESVWKVPLGGPKDEQCTWVIVKAMPYHSAQRIQELRADGLRFQGWARNRERDMDWEVDVQLQERDIRTEEQARYEAVTAARINADCARLYGQEEQQEEQEAAATATTPTSASGMSATDIYVPPLCVVTQPCPLEGGYKCAGHDRQALLVFPFQPAGDAAQYLASMVDRLQEALLLPIRAQHAARSLNKALIRLTVDMLTHTARVHAMDQVLCDHKLHNMVFAGDADGFKLIDAEAVRACPLGSWLAGGSRHTPGFAPPEQEQQLWMDSRCDMYACGASIQAAFDMVEQRVLEMLGPMGSPSFSRVWPILSPTMAILMILASDCMAEQPQNRPTAHQARDWLLAALQGPTMNSL